MIYKCSQGGLLAKQLLESPSLKDYDQSISYLNYVDTNVQSIADHALMAHKLREAEVGRRILENL